MFSHRTPLDIIVLSLSRSSERVYVEKRNSYTAKIFIRDVTRARTFMICCRLSLTSQVVLWKSETEITLNIHPWRRMSLYELTYGTLSAFLSNQWLSTGLSPCLVFMCIILKMFYIKIMFFLADVWWCFVDFF